MARGTLNLTMTTAPIHQRSWQHSCCSPGDAVLPLPWEDTTHQLNDDEHISNSETLFPFAGTGPLVLAAPHGGNLLPTTIPDRTSGCTEPDIHSAQLAWAVFRQCRRRHTSPSLVIGKLHRRKVDLARARNSSAESDAGRAPWDEYHLAVQRMLDSTVARYGYAHLVDIHGQSHREATEVGHLLTNSDLRNSVLDPEKSSISAMAHLPTVSSIEDVVRGPNSIGTLLEVAGYAAVPSTRVPHPCCMDCECLQQYKDQICSKADTPACCSEGSRPCTGFDVKKWKDCPGGCGPCSFFWGSNSLIMYGGGRTSTEGQQLQLLKYRSVVAATQLETPWAGARENQDQIESFGSALGDAITGFVERFYPTDDNDTALL